MNFCWNHDKLKEIFVSFFLNSLFELEDVLSDKKIITWYENLIKNEN